jgi:hypothetical protein
MRSRKRTNRTFFMLAISVALGSACAEAPTDPGEVKDFSEFSLTVSPKTEKALAGEVSVRTVLLEREVASFDGNVRLSVATPQALTSWGFAPNPATATSSSRLTFIMGQNWHGDGALPITIRGQSALSKCDFEFFVQSVEPPADNAPPVVGIDAPTDGSHFQQGQPVTFTGTADDTEDGSLIGNSLVWTSNLMNGPIGTGTQFTTGDLVVGNHTITLTATDSEGATGAADVGISVDSPASCTGLVPMADTHVRGGSFAYSPFGTSTSLLIKGIASLEYARKAYLVFDISALPASFASATLQLTLAGNAGINPREISLYGVIDNDDWDPAILSEESITWTDAPRNVTTSGIAFEGQGTTATDGVRLLATSTLDNTDPPGTTYTFDITEYVNWALGDNPALSALAPAGDSDGHITLLLAHSAEIVGDNGPWFWSREAAEACNRPQLVVH